MGDNAMEELEAAWDSSEEDTLEEPIEAEGEVEEYTSTEPELEVEEEVETPVLEADTASDVEPPTLEEEEDKAPVGLSLGAREEWKNTPKAMRDEIAKRERDFSVGMQKNAEGAKRAAGMDHQLQPYQQYFAMNGGAGQSIKTALETASTLQMGTPQQRAQTVANLIQQFGVDIDALDSMLVGEAPSQESQQQYSVQQAVQQAVAPYQQQMTQMAQRQEYEQQQIRQNAVDEVGSFSNDRKNEFYHDVKMDMADLMDMAQARGINLTMQDSYDRACRMNPEISRIMASRVGNASVQNKRRAASSVVGSPGGVTDSAGGGSLHSAIADAWDNSGRQ